MNIIKNLELYGESKISLLTDTSGTDVNITLDNLTFSGRKISRVYSNDVNNDIVITDINSHLLFHLLNQIITTNISPNMITITTNYDEIGNYTENCL
jgi:hypothetical protein